MTRATRRVVLGIVLIAGAACTAREPVYYTLRPELTLADVNGIAPQTDSSFTDELLQVTARAEVTYFAVSLRNQTSESLRVLWDRGSFIDVRGEASRIVHGGINYGDVAREQPPTVIPSGQFVREAVYPAARISGRLHRPLIAAPRRLVIPGDQSDAGWRSLAESADTLIGRRVGLMLPIETPSTGSVREYTLWFVVDTAVVASELSIRLLE